MSDAQPAGAMSLADQKLQREIEKLDVEIAAARRSVSLERLKAWGTLLAPVATALTIIGALWVGIAQLDSKRDEDEDQAWRDTVKALGDKTTDPTTSSTLLQPFLRSKRYRTSAVATTAHVLPNLLNEDVFGELTNAAFGNAKPSDFAELLAIARTLSNTDAGLTGKINASADDTANPVGPKPVGPTQEEAKTKRSIVRGELQVLCVPIAAELRNYSHRALAQAASQSESKRDIDAVADAQSNIIDMSGIYFNRCDFSDIDLRDVDFGVSTLNFVKLDRARLGDATKVMQADNTPNDYIWGGIVWWTAKYITPHTLQQLITQYKPYQAHGPEPYGYRRDESVDADSWRTDVRRLCTAAGLTCSDTDIQMPPRPKN